MEFCQSEKVGTLFRYLGEIEVLTSKMGVDCVFAVGFFTSGIRSLFQVGTCS